MKLAVNIFLFYLTVPLPVNGDERNALPFLFSATESDKLDVLPNRPRNLGDIDSMCPTSCSGEGPKELLVPGVCSQDVLDLFCVQSTRDATRAASNSCTNDKTTCYCKGTLLSRDCTMDQSGENCNYQFNSKYGGSCAPWTTPSTCSTTEKCYGNLKQAVNVDLPTRSCHSDSPAVKKICSTAKQVAKIKADISCDPNNVNPQCSCDGTYMFESCDATTITTNKVTNVSRCKISMQYRYLGQCSATSIVKPSDPDTCAEICAGGVQSEDRFTNCSNEVIARYCHEADVTSLEGAKKICDVGSSNNPSCACLGEYTSATCRVEYNEDKSCTVYRDYRYQGACNYVTPPTAAPSTPLSPNCSDTYCTGKSGNTIKKIAGNCDKSRVDRFCREAKLKAKVEADLQCDLENQCSCKGEYKMNRCYSVPFQSNDKSYCIFVAKYMYEGYCHSPTVLQVV